MVSSVTSSPANTVGSSSATLTQIKTDLVAALQTAGISDAKSSDATPKGFPDGVSWSDAYKMVAQRKEDNNPATSGNLLLSADLLKKTLAATKNLKDLGYANLSRFPKGSSVMGAIEELFRDKSKGIMASTLAKAGIYDLSAFPTGTTAYQAFKLIEDPASPGKISVTRFNALKEAYSALSALGIKSLDNFPRGTTTLEAKALLEPKATSMLSMIGVSASYFKDPAISSLEAMSILSNLPNSIREMNPLPVDTTSASLLAQANAAKKLVAMGYENLTGFASMQAFTSQTPAAAVTATAALAQVTKLPKPGDLPLTTSSNTERLFQNPSETKTITFGTPNPVTRSVLTPSSESMLTANKVPATTVVTAAQVMATNLAYWSK